MTCDLREGEESADPSPELHALLGILASPGLRLGSGTTRGLGKIRFTEITAASFDVKTPRGILDLAESAASQGHGVALGEAFTIAETDDRELSTPCIQIDWKPILPLLVGDGLPGDAVDHWPFVVARRAPGGQAAAPRAVAVLPGSSIKGALRSRAEWVIRTIAGPQLQGDERFQDQIDVPVVDSLFGVVAGRRLGYRRGALRFSDCTADLISSKDAKPVSWESWEKVRFEQSTKADRERHLVTSLENLGLSHLVPRSHIAIDRWTGSVAGSRLFSEIEPWCLKWSPIKIELDPRMVPRSESERLAGAALLLLVLDELVAGTITFGSRATRGYGSVHVDAEAIDYSGIAELCPDLRDLDLRNGLRSLPDKVRFTLSEALCAVVDAAFLEEVQR
jgi:CRISPR/Cas system CSM-associated protein Csm3 (group 7 of RAMP superfamily)